MTDNETRAKDSATDSPSLSDVIQRLRDIFQSTRKTAELSEIKRIKKLALFSYTAVTGHNGELFPFQHDKAEHLMNLAVALYLEKWLESDENCRQSIHAFAVAPYTSSRVKNRKEYEEKGTLSYIKLLQRAENIFYNMQEQQRKQAEKEGSSSSPWPKIEHSRREHDYITLRFLELYANRKLDLFRLLTLRKTLMGALTKGKDTHALVDAYLQYDSIFEETKTESSDKLYVISCIQLRKFESAFRFHLAAKVAEYILSHRKPSKRIKNRIPQNFTTIWGRRKHQALFWDKMNINEPYDILLYEEEIPLALKMEKIPDNSIQLWRNTLADVLSLMYLLYPTEHQPSWTDKDFKDAADFFKSDYPIVESHKSVFCNLNEKDCTTEKLCNMIKRIYQDLSVTDNVTLNSFREVMKRNGRKKIKD